MKPWKRWTLIVAWLLIGYILSPVPLRVSLQRIGLWTPAVQEAFVIAYYPLIIVALSSEPVGQFYLWQQRYLFGEGRQ